MSETGYRSHLVPHTLWEKLYLAWFLVCFLMVWVGTWAVNEPVAVLGMPIVFVWCSGWGIVWLTGCMFLGFKIEKQDETRGE